MNNNKKHIVVVTPCFNEIENIEEIALSVESEFGNLKNYSYTHLFIDNSSTDGSIEKLKEISLVNSNISAIVNSRNFGYIRSSFYGLIALDSDATILISCDFQEPPELIPKFIHEWENGNLVVGGIKTQSDESFFKRFLRTFYYKTVNKFSDVELIDHFFDFALYDRDVIKKLREVEDSKPYLRGLICELGYEIKEVEFKQQKRKRGNTKQNWYGLMDTALIGLTSQSKVPLRFATILGIVLAFVSFFASMFYLIAKLVMWESFDIGIAPIVVGLFFIASFQLIAIGLIGEYIGSIHSQSIKRDFVIERERINL